MCNPGCPCNGTSAPLNFILCSRCGGNQRVCAHQPSIELFPLDDVIAELGIDA